MLSDNLYKHVLIEPAEEGATLYAVSGYATATMATRHLQDLQAKKRNARIRLIIGMTAKDGILESNHKGLCKLVEQNDFRCSYVPENAFPVHAKTYAWFNGKSPLAGFVGSANYTQAAFFQHQREVMDKSDPAKILAYYKQLESISFSCSCPEAQGLVHDDNNAQVVWKESESAADKFSDKASVTSSFLADNGKLPQKSGLNWGQRPEHRRDPDEAYIRVPKKIAELGFFPKKGVRFTLHTDDGHKMVCVVAQGGDKAIETPDDNSLIGKYFRRRLDVQSGKPVELQHLLNYGRTDATYYKIDNKNYLMDFSVK